MGNHQQNQMNRQQGFGLAYLFFIFFIIYIVAPLFRPQPYFSLSLNSEYRYKVNTDILETQYYAR